MRWCSDGATAFLIGALVISGIAAWIQWGFQLVGFYERRRAERRRWAGKRMMLTPEGVAPGEDEPESPKVRDQTR